MIDLARWLVGDLARVSARLSMFLDRPGVDGGTPNPTNDSATLSIESVTGRQGVIQLSSLSYLGKSDMDQRIVLHGEAGTVEVTCSFTSAEIRGAREGEEKIHVLPVPESHLSGVDQGNPYHAASQFYGEYMFIDSILEDRPISPSFLDGLKAQEVIDAAKESHEKGCWVSLA